MPSIMQSRRSFLSLVGKGLIAAPAVVSVASLMPISAAKLTPAWPRLFAGQMGQYNGWLLRSHFSCLVMYGDGSTAWETEAA